MTQDLFTGMKTFRFSELHGTSEITAMAFDSLGRRLITGARGTYNFIVIQTYRNRRQYPNLEL